MITIHSQGKLTLINAERISVLEIDGFSIVAKLVDDDQPHILGIYNNQEDCKKVMAWLAASLSVANDNKALTMPTAEVVANLNYRPIAEKIIVQAEKLKAEKEKCDDVSWAPAFEDFLKKFRGGGSQ